MRGRAGRSSPGLVRREYDEGHTIGTHTETYPDLAKMPLADAENEIQAAIADVNSALGPTRATTSSGVSDLQSSGSTSMLHNDDGVGERGECWGWGRGCLGGGGVVVFYQTGYIQFVLNRWSLDI